MVSIRVQPAAEMSQHSKLIFPFVWSANMHGNVTAILSSDLPPVKRSFCFSYSDPSGTAADAWQKQRANEWKIERKLDCEKKKPGTYMERSHYLDFISIEILHVHLDISWKKVQKNNVHK